LNNLTIQIAQQNDKLNGSQKHVVHSRREMKPQEKTNDSIKLSHENIHSTSQTNRKEARVVEFFFKKTNDICREKKHWGGTRIK
jgi:hypothetical protein